jgi:hypothetical protein
VNVEEAICARVAGLTAVIALASTRVYLDKFPQSPTYPAVRVQLVDDADEQHLRGPLGIKRARVQIDHCAHESSGSDPYAEAETLAAATKGDGLGTSASGIAGFKGTIGSPAFAIEDCKPVLRTRDYDPAELRVVTIRQDYDVTYRG